MADPGIGFGFGRGLAQIGESLSRRYEIEALAGLQQREKRADQLLFQIQSDAQNNAPLGYEYQKLSGIPEEQRSPMEQQRHQYLTDYLTKAQERSKAWRTE